ncbi:MAG: D-cysteine desulfhydrase family protein [Ignavibacteria bacterium]|nr:D-cysteine desulfhydrase family protein [Ignavibacteria bacterium]
MKNNIARNFPVLGYSLLPTRIHKLENISKLMNANIYCKRDDLTGFAFGGNKTRKLDYLIADALKNKYDTIIAAGANQSNFCRIASAYGAAAGLKTYLVLGGGKPDIPSGNLMLDYLFGAEIIHVDSEEWDIWENEAVKLESYLNGQGKKVYRMPVGGSTPVGALGYVEAVREIIDYSTDTGINFGNIFFPTGSAGTQSGLIAGKALYGLKSALNGIAITKNAKQITDEVSALTDGIFGILEIKKSEYDIKVDDNYIGAKYGAFTESADEAVNLFAKKEGILLDYVYSGKAAAGMFDYIREKKIPKNVNILFIHTGGNIQLFK